MRLPIDDLLPDVQRVLRDGLSLVLEAPPGAGKTTRVPPALLDEPWLAGRRILMLEPRRLAARAAAEFMATEMGEAVGRTVGYRMRLDTRVGPDTRIEVVTEGVLTRMLQADPSLEGTGIVVFDEYHERSVHADLGLALCLQARSVLRPDLRIAIMSATLDGEPVARLLGDAGRVRSEGRTHAVETRHVPKPRGQRIEDAVANAVVRAIDEDEGDVLAFLPGAAEIRRTAERLVAHGLGAVEGRPPHPSHATVDVVPLFGNLPRERQQRAIRPSPAGRRKVVLATSIAETSLTIEGVRVVIDSGLMRVPRFSPRTGMTRLETVRVTRDAADQRRGRAGRTSPGVCYRLWAEEDEAGFVARRTPEILEADLAPLALELAAWGVRDPAELRWLDAPPAAAFAQARELLAELGALDGNGAITAHGREIAAMPAHPRLAHMLGAAGAIGAAALACDLAALLGDRDILRGRDAAADPDVRFRLEALGAARARSGRPRSPLRGHAIDGAALAQVRREARDWRRRLGLPGEGDAGSDEPAGLLLAFAYPDRIAQSRTRGRFLMRNGHGVRVATGTGLAGEPWIVAAHLTGRGGESLVALGAPLDPADLESHFAEQIERSVDVAWDTDTRSVRARTTARLGAIVLREAASADAGPGAILAALLDAILASRLELLPWTDAARSARARIEFLRTLDPSWPDTGDDALLETLDTWLAPFLHGHRTADDLGRLDLRNALLQRLRPDQRASLDTLAPTHVTVPSGSRIAIDYGKPAAPVLAVRIQEMFGLAETPRIAGGRVPLTLHLLSPAMRPVQVTRDLGSFWRTGYFDVRKDLRGRYPKHPWPDDPLTAAPTRRTRRRGRE